MATIFNTPDETPAQQRTRFAAREMFLKRQCDGRLAGTWSGAGATADL